jgi:hypothetical protein
MGNNPRFASRMQSTDMTNKNRYILLGKEFVEFSSLRGQNVFKVTKYC